MNINGYIQKHKLPIKGIHLADVLAAFRVSLWFFASQLLSFVQNTQW
jgi:hypothetical protein